MAGPSLAEMLAGLTDVQKAELLDEVSPAERAALVELLPSSRAEYVDAPSPVDLAARLQPGWHTASHLQVVSDAFAAACTNGGRLIVNLPPQHGKSQTVSRWGATWYLDRWPGRNVICMSYAQQLARDRTREVRDTFMEATGLHTSVRRGRATQTQWETVDGGGMLAAGVGGGVTGHGAHLFIVDDPFKNWEAAHSRANRDKVWNEYRSVALTRLAPNAVEVLVMTRWHEDDLAGRLLSDEWEGDPNEWTVIRIPAICEDPDTDLLGRQEGEPLVRPDTDMTVAEAGAWLEQKRRDLGPYLWNGLYQQRPGAAQGTIFKRGWWQFYRTGGDTPPQRDSTLLVDDDRLDVAAMRVSQSWDMSFKDTRDSSYVVGQVWGVHPSRPADRFLLDQVRARMGFAETERRLVGLHDRWPSTDRTFVEDKANGPAVIDHLRRTIGGLKPVSPGGDSKETRAWAAQGVVESGNVWLPSPELCPWVREFVDELADFPNGAHDDQVDATTYALRELRQSRDAKIGVAQGTMPTRIRRVR